MYSNPVYEFLRHHLGSGTCEVIAKDEVFVFPHSQNIKVCAAWDDFNDELSALEGDVTHEICSCRVQFEDRIINFGPIGNWDDGLPSVPDLPLPLVEQNPEVVARRLLSQEGSPREVRDGFDRCRGPAWDRWVSFVLKIQEGAKMNERWDWDGLSVAKVFFDRNPDLAPGVRK